MKNKKTKNLCFKKAFFILVNVLFSLSQIYGQTLESAMSSMPSTGISYKSSIIRSDKNDKYVVSYNNNVSGHEFQLHNNTNLVEVIRLNSNMWIEDFQILHNRVYFCGRLDKKGIIGYFDLHEFYSSTPTINYFIHNSTNTVTSLVVFDMNTLGDIRLAAVGVKASTISPAYEPDETYIIDCICQSGFWSMEHYPASGLGTIYCWLGSISDITVTDNYVVTVGPRQYATDSSAGEILLCRFDKNVWSSNIDRYSISTNFDWETASTMKIEHLQDDDIATAVLNIIDNNTYGTVIRVYDMTTVTNINSQRLNIVQKFIPKDLQYLSQYKTLLLLQDDEHLPTNVQSYVNRLTPYSSGSYSSLAYYINNLNLESLTHLNNGFLSAGDMMGINAFFYKHVGLNPQEICHKIHPITINSISARSFQLHITQTFIPFQETWISEQEIHDKYLLQIDCENYK